MEIPRQISQEQGTFDQFKILITEVKTSQAQILGRIPEN
jgi:hypothetical protein